MTTHYDVITFDCYGTLIDWNAGIGDALSELASTAGLSVDRAGLLAAYHHHEPLVQAEAQRSYREVLRETATRVARELGWELPANGANRLPESLAGWPPFSDTVAALQRLHAAGHRLGILSNIDDDLLAETRKRLGVPFDLIITAQQVGSYKPARGHFDQARREIGDARWLHAAQSYFHDIEPATALGIPSAWINRLRESRYGDARPLREFPDLASLVDWLTGDA